MNYEELVQRIRDEIELGGDTGSIMSVVHEWLKDEGFTDEWLKDE